MISLPIGVVDSGVGGLSIYSEIKKLLPQENIIYLADQAYCPYGFRSDEEIRQRVILQLRFLVKQHIKLAVVACNTATTVGIDYYRSQFPDLPIVGVVPVIKTAVKTTKTKNVLVLATQKTVESQYIRMLIKEFGDGIHFYLLRDNGCLVKKVEKGSPNAFEIRFILRQMLSPYRQKNIDTIVLGCTHFPFLEPAIVDAWGKAVAILDSGGAVARQVHRVLEHNGQLAHNPNPRYTFYTTGNHQSFRQTAIKLLSLPQMEVKHLKL